MTEEEALRAHIGLIRWCANKYKSMVPWIEYEDLVQMMCERFIVLYRKYNPNLATANLATYTTHQMKWVVLDEIKRSEQGKRVGEKRTISLDELTGNEAGMTDTFVDKLENPKLERDIDITADRITYAENFKKLKPREQLIMTMIADGYEMQTIADKLKVSASRCHQIWTAASKKLKK